MPDYGRDLNIGIPTIKNLTRPIEVQNLDGVIASIGEVESGIDESIKVQEQIRLGAGLAISADLSEEE